jgi:nitrite reductase/ring-hydroxylating ferredoxin subunit
MERKEFIAQLGLGAAFVLTAGCFGSCKKDSTPDSGSNPAVDFTLDLTAPANAALATNGGFLVSNGVVVAKSNAGAYVAATQKCSHQGLNQITLANNEWTCTAHGAKFSLSGSGLNSNGSNGLKIYNTAVTGNSLRVFS